MCEKYNEGLTKSICWFSSVCVCLLVIISVTRTDTCTLMQKIKGHLFSESSNYLVIHFSYQIKLPNPANVFFFLIFSDADRQHMPLAHFRNIIFSKLKRQKTNPTQYKICVLFSILFFIYIFIQHVRKKNLI